MTMPLDGIRVIDLTMVWAGPFGTRMLGDYGAEVIKVEPPSGDYWRHGNEVPPQPRSEIPYQFHLANRNKRGMALDLKSPSAQPVLEKRVARRSG